LRPVQAKGLEHPGLSRGAPYDLVLANILAQPLRALAPRIARAAAPGADVVLSGLIARDVPGVLAAYRTQGFALVRRLEIDGWVSLQLGRAQRPIEARVREASSAPSRA
jgi:ribosomal protein L11 methyltransferase